jgi:tetratricopeptide (TPR) repeat protein
MNASNLEIPEHLHNDIIALITYLEKQAPKNANRSKVAPADLARMEATAGFSMPPVFREFWLKGGAAYWEDEKLTVLSYCYTDYSSADNTLYRFLYNSLLFTGKKSEFLEQEIRLLYACWIVGMIREGDKRTLFVSDALGKVHIVHIDRPFTKLGDGELRAVLASILEQRDALADFMATVKLPDEDEDVPHRRDTAEEEEDEDEDEEDAVKQAFLEKHRLEELTYEEVLERMGLEQLFDYWDGESGVSIMSLDNYEDEPAYFEDYSRIYYCDGDLDVDSLDIEGLYIDLLVVKGNLTVRDSVAAWGGGGMAYYVTGNTTIDKLQIDELQKTLGQESVRYLAYAWADDHEMLNKLSRRKIDAPVFLSWFYDLNCFEFAPDTLITALYEYDDLSAYKTTNAFLPWHDFASAFRTDLYYPVEKEHHDNLNLNIGGIYAALKKGESIFKDGVTKEGILLTNEGQRLLAAEDVKGAWKCFKKAMEVAPGYYLAYCEGGKLLFKEKAYRQAMEVFAKGMPFKPEKLGYENTCAEQAALCAVRIGEYNQAIEWSLDVLETNADAYFAMRVIGEAAIFTQHLEDAKAYLKKSQAIKSIFSTNWLLGLVYHLEGDQKKAEEFYQQAARNSGRAKPYSEHTDMGYIYGTPVVLDWV